MRYVPSRRQWEHTDAEEAMHGLSRTPREDMPPSLVKELAKMPPLGLVRRLFNNIRHFSDCICVTCEEARTFLGIAPPARALAAPPAGPEVKPEPKCIIGERCVRHDFVHGWEAEHLRQEMERYAEEHELDWLSDLLQTVDARDSLAYIEAVKKEDETQPKHISRTLAGRTAAPPAGVGAPLPRVVPCAFCKGKRGGCEGCGWHSEGGVLVPEPAPAGTGGRR